MKVIRGSAQLPYAGGVGKHVAEGGGGELPHLEALPAERVAGKALREPVPVHTDLEV